MKVKIKKLHPDAVIPKYSKPGDAGLDLVAVQVKTDICGNIVYSTGLSVEIPEGYVGLLYPRSSICKTDLFFTNSVGVIDSGYRGEICVKMSTYRMRNTEHYNKGDRIGQLIIMPYPQIEFEEVEELSASERGAGGYGSTGR